MRAPEQLNVAVLGAGMIGLDLITKIQQSSLLHCGLVAGRDGQSRGLRMAASMGYATATGGVTSLVDAPEPFDLVFDASNATSHAEHWSRLDPFGTVLVDLTPSRVGHMVVPTVNGDDVAEHRNVSMISCGGQAAVPILHALSRDHPLEYVEVVTTASSASVGRATRLNLDEYLETTQDAVRRFTGAAAVKAMVNLSPARPSVPFRVAMWVVAPTVHLDEVRSLTAAAEEEVRAFVPGFRRIACTEHDGVFSIVVEVTAAGGRLPAFAGNVDIINAAAVLVAEQHAARRMHAMGTGVA